MQEMEIEAAAPSSRMGRRFRVALALLVGVVAISAAALAWLETNSGRQEESAFVNASRNATDAFVKIAASQPRLYFQLAAIRESTLLDAQATARPVELGNDPLPFQLSLSVSSADNEASRRLLGLTEAMSTLPDLPADLDTRASEAIRLEGQEEADQIYAAQAAALENAAQHGTRQERAMFALGLVAISASILGIAGLTGEGRAGRALLGTAGASIVVAWLSAGSGFA